MHPGYNSGGKFKTYQEHTKIYRNWIDIFSRCYSEKQQKKQPRYIGCTVSEDWYDYQNFALWYVENKHVGRETWQIDKDILVRGNRIYGPQFCCVVPQEINLLVGRRQSCRGDLPIGVEYHPQSMKYRASMSYDAKRKHIALCATPEEAFYMYKQVKERYIKVVADKYKGKIDNNVYEALYNYEVSITD